MFDMLCAMKLSKYDLTSPAQPSTLLLTESIRNKNSNYQFGSVEFKSRKSSTGCHNLA